MQHAFAISMNRIIFPSNLTDVLEVVFKIGLVSCFHYISSLFWSFRITISCSSENCRTINRRRLGIYRSHYYITSISCWDDINTTFRNYRLRSPVCFCPISTRPISSREPSARHYNLLQYGFHYHQQLQLFDRVCH